MDALEAPGARSSFTGLADVLPEALREIIPNVEIGSFSLEDRHLGLMPKSVGERLRGYAGWMVTAFAIPITDEGLWLWHYDGRRRRLFANSILQEAGSYAIQRLRESGVRAEILTALVGQEISMTEVGCAAGMGTRGWNNLLLHPKYGAWLQIEAIVVDWSLKAAPPPLDDVCIYCAKCIEACPASALGPGTFHPDACRVLVAAPWMSRSKARALTQSSYVECHECISSCPIGSQPSTIKI